MDCLTRQTAERRAVGAARRNVAHAPLAAERQAVSQTYRLVVLS
jgi:hypothetical protein